MTNINQLRKEKKLTQQEIAELLGVTRQTYSRIEKWEVELSLWQAVKLADLYKCSVSDFVDKKSSEVVYTDASFDWDKYKQIIKSFIRYAWAKHDQKITKTKLPKLCYLLDFARFYNHLKPITGLQYRRIKQWPVPDIYFTTIEELVEDESILLEIKWSAHMISNITDAQDDLLDTDEKILLKKISEKRQTFNTDNIVTFTHNQLPWMMCDDKELISYDFITQEDPANVY